MLIQSGSPTTVAEKQHNHRSPLLASETVSQTPARQKFLLHVNQKHVRRARPSKKAKKQRLACTLTKLHNGDCSPRRYAAAEWPTDVASLVM